MNRPLDDHNVRVGPSAGPARADGTAGSGCAPLPSRSGRLGARTRRVESLRPPAVQKFIIDDVPLRSTKSTEGQADIKMEWNRLCLTMDLGGAKQSHRSLPWKPLRTRRGACRLPTLLFQLIRGVPPISLADRER